MVVFVSEWQLLPFACFCTKSSPEVDENILVEDFQPLLNKLHLFMYLPLILPFHCLLIRSLYTSVLTSFLCGSNGDVIDICVCSTSFMRHDTVNVCLCLTSSSNNTFFHRVHCDLLLPEEEVDISAPSRTPGKQ